MTGLSGLVSVGRSVGPRGPGDVGRGTDDVRPADPLSWFGAVGSTHWTRTTPTSGPLTRSSISRVGGPDRGALGAGVPDRVDGGPDRSQDAAVASLGRRPSTLGCVSPVRYRPRAGHQGGERW